MTNEERIKAAWQGRISGCLLGKPVEMISMREGPQGLNKFLEESGSLPLRNYVNYMEHEMLRGANKKCCLGMMDKAEVGSGCLIQNSVICEGVKIESNSNISDCMIGKDVTIAEGSKLKGEIRSDNVL